MAHLPPAPATTERGLTCRAGDGGQPTIFDKIISKQIPANIIYEDDEALAFRDINPQGPVHFLVIPKIRNGLTGLSKATEEHKGLLGHLLLVAAKVCMAHMCLHVCRQAGRQASTASWPGHAVNAACCTGFKAGGAG